MIEFSLLRYLLIIQSLFLTFEIVTLIVDVPAWFFNAGVNGMYQGFYIYSHKVVPVYTLRAFFMFFVITIFGRLLITKVSSSQLFKGDLHRQATIYTLITYLTFIIATFVALLIMRVDVRGLGMVLGALSVGLGFGLQHLAADLVGGIIILLQKPVKLGDHILINTVDGYVKKIRLLSTQVSVLSLTPSQAQSVVVIPNSIIVSSALTNYTLRNQLWTIDVRFILESGDELEQAKQLLLAVAAENTKVLQTPPNQPLVSLEMIVTSAAANHHLLHLWCTIEDVQQKQRISSDLTFAAIKVFRDNNIALRSI